MSASAAVQPTLAAALWPAEGSARVLRAVLFAVAGTGLLTLSAKVQVPFWPVPMTMQTFVVMMLGLTLGPRLGAATVLLYLAEGATGLPVFAGTPEKGIGLAYMAGPTGGYLAGFVVAAALVGGLAERGWDRSLIGTLAAMGLGTAALYACGLGWLSSLIGIEKAVQFGLLPFLPAAALKIALAAALMPAAWKVVARRG